jgi:nitroimidazol reductase NimA-like FMN-containing flavoprotein (pyridoxamine 5'-phosphate oxidase superfamily)
MPEPTASSEVPINRVRRRDRAVEDPAWIRAFLAKAPYGVVATESQGQPFMNPVLFAYDQESNSLVFHTSRAGRIYANIAANPRVCFCVSEMGRLLPAGRAAGFDVEYSSVVIHGRARVLDDEGETLRGLRLLLSKYFPDLKYGKDYAEAPPADIARPAVYRVDIDSWSGKRNIAPSET